MGIKTITTSSCVQVSMCEYWYDKLNINITVILGYPLLCLWYQAIVPGWSVQHILSLSFNLILPFPQPFILSSLIPNLVIPYFYLHRYLLYPLQTSLLAYFTPVITLRYLVSSCSSVPNPFLISHSDLSTHIPIHVHPSQPSSLHTSFFPYYLCVH